MVERQLVGPFVQKGTRKMLLITTPSPRPNTPTWLSTVLALPPSSGQPDMGARGEGWKRRLYDPDAYAARKPSLFEGMGLENNTCYFGPMLLRTMF